MTDKRKQCLVVVEDNPSDVQLLEFTLQDAGLECETLVLVDGLKALNWVHEFLDRQDLPVPDLIVVDLNLPKHDGIEILEAIQQTPQLAKTPILVLSSSPSPRDAARARVFPNTRYMMKPTDLDGYGDLAGVLKQMLGVGPPTPA